MSDDPAALLEQELILKDQVFGTSDKSQQLIMLRPGLAPGFARQILVHEIVHQLFDDSGLEPEGEEQICQSLQAPLLAVLKDNPDLVTWLTSED